MADTTEFRELNIAQLIGRDIEAEISSPERRLRAPIKRFTIRGKPPRWVEIRADWVADFDLEHQKYFLHQLRNPYDLVVADFDAWKTQVVNLEGGILLLQHSEEPDFVQKYKIYPKGNNLSKEEILKFL